MASIEVPVDGRELGMLVSASLMIAFWPFRQPTARKLVDPDKRRFLSRINREIFREMKHALEAADAFLPTNGEWTPEFITRRKSVRATVRLTPKRLQALGFALRVCHKEFRRHWHDFCIAGTGNLDYLGVEPRDLLVLAARLERGNPSKV